MFIRRTTFVIVTSDPKEKGEDGDPNRHRNVCVVVCVFKNVVERLQVYPSLKIDGIRHRCSCICY